MYSSILALAILPALQTVVHANPNSAYGFTANTFLMYENTTYWNHPAFAGYVEARGSVFRFNKTGDQPLTYCPPAVRAKKRCPRPVPADVKTQFNTTLDQDGDAGPVHMNVAVPGGQQLYVARNGLLQYTQPNKAPPAGSYTKLFKLHTEYQGSQLDFSTPIMAFNDTYYFYSCKDPKGGLNLTYAKTPAAKVDDCAQFALISDVVYYSGYNACPQNPQYENGKPVYSHCGFATYQYQ